MRNFLNAIKWVKENCRIIEFVENCLREERKHDEHYDKFQENRQGDNGSVPVFVNVFLSACHFLMNKPETCDAAEKNSI